MESNAKIVVCPVLHSTVFQRCRSKATARWMIIDSVSYIKIKVLSMCGNRHIVFVSVFIIMHGVICEPEMSSVAKPMRAMCLFIATESLVTPDTCNSGVLLQIRQTFPRSGDVSSFKWKDYCPLIFRRLRSIFGIDDADYMLSLTGDS